jgi:predicted nucleic acid-binding protein
VSTTRWVYCDTSAMARRYVREAGRDALMKLLSKQRVVSSVLMPAELHSAFARRVREGSLATIALPQLFSRVAADSRRWTLVAPTREVLEEMDGLLELHPLRTLDALHVASARVFERRLGSPVTFVSADARQAAAAARTGLATRFIR